VLKVGGATETSVYQHQWLVAPDVGDYRADFQAIGPNAAGKISGQKAKAKMVESKLPPLHHQEVRASRSADEFPKRRSQRRFSFSKTALPRSFGSPISCKYRRCKPCSR